MAMDWFDVSAPLVALPIVLLFLFVGCNAFLGLDDKVFDANGWLHLGTFTDTSDIKSIEISIGFTLDSTGESPTNLRAGITMSGAQIAALLNSGGWPGLSLDLTAQPDGVLGCSGIVTLTGLASMPFSIPVPSADAAALFIPSSTTPTAEGYFELSRGGNDFNLIAVS